MGTSFQRNAQGNLETVKHSTATLDYTFDWSDWVADGDSVAASEWTVDAGITVNSSSTSGTLTTAWLTGGTSGATYKVRNTVTTAQGRADYREFYVVVNDSFVDAPTGITAQDLLYQVMPRLKNTDGSGFYEALNATIQVINNRLWVLRSPMIIGTFSTNVAIGASTVNLPADFLGFAESPYIVERRTYLSPLPQALSLRFASNGAPKHYLSSGLQLTLYPTPDETATFEVRYFKAPAKITAGTDVLPYNGFFDLVIRDGIVEAANLGMYATSRPEFVAMISSQVDRLVRLRTPPRVRFLFPLTGRQ